MPSMSRNPDNPPFLDELGDLLRPAVEQVRQSPPPEDALGRSLQRARRIGRSRPRPWRLRPPQLLFSGAVAATLILGCLFHFGSYPTGGNRLVFPGEKRGRSEDRLAHVGEKAAPSRIRIRNNGPFIAPELPGGTDSAIRIGELPSHWDTWDRVERLHALGVKKPLRLFQVAARAEGGALAAQAAQHAQVFTPEDPLRLKGLYVQVLVEGVRARTLVDHIFHNPARQPQTGTFEYPLPDGASPAYFAWFPGQGTHQPGAAQPGKPRTVSPLPPLPSPAEAVRAVDPGCWGRPRQAHVVTNDQGEPVPEPPPALAHSGDEPRVPAGSAFRGAIGPLAPGGLCRIVFAYEETLPLRDGRVEYEFPLPGVSVPDASFRLQADAASFSRIRFLPEGFVSREADGRVQYARVWKNARPGGVVRFSARPRDPTVQQASGRHSGGSRFLVARVLPNLPAKPRAAFARHAVFLLDASGGDAPERFASHLALLRNVLEADRDLERFNVLTFSTSAGWVTPNAWIPNTPKERDSVLKRLGETVPEGAVDLSAAFAKILALDLPLPPNAPLHCFLLSDGKVSWGESDPRVLVAPLHAAARPLRWECYPTGHGETNEALFEALTRTGGGIHPCNDLQAIRAAALAHRRACLAIDRVRFVGGPAASDVLVAGRKAAVHPGGGLLVAARFEGTGKARLVIDGKLDGAAASQSFPVEVRDGGQLAPRAWAELAVGSLLAAGDPRLEPAAAAYAQEFGIATRLTSFALCDSPPPAADIDEERLRLGRGDVPGWVEAGYRRLARPLTPAGRRGQLAQQVRGWAPTRPLRTDLLDLIEVIPEREFLLLTPGLPGRLTRNGEAGKEYLSALREGRFEPGVYLEEALRREKAGDLGPAAAVLSGALKANPGNPDVVRLVGYHLVGTGQAARAVPLLEDHVAKNPQDPAAHRALAAALAEANRPGLAAVHYELAQAFLGGRGGWYGAVREEHLRLLRRTRRDESLPAALRERMKARWQELDQPRKADLRVSATWNAVASTVSLQVKDGSGNLLPVTSDTRGHRQGPLVCTVEAARKGPYSVEVVLTRALPEATPETAVFVEIVRKAGTAAERAEGRTVLLRKVGDAFVLGRLRD